jgi:dihydrofolate synthase/folylpolyglutamate synthase
MSFEAAQGKLPDATFFELMTALAFEAIAASEVEIFICEVGLGGRMDSTNILSPDLSILTSIGLDHTEWLGSTEEKIAFEKSFISRRNRPLIIGPISQSAKMGISSALEITGAKAVFIEPLDEDSTIDHFVSPHVSDSQTDSVQRPSKNAVPLPSLEICREALRHLSHRDGLKFSPDQLFASAQSTRWPGRADLRTINATPVLLDGAHNSHGVSYFLSHTLRDTVLKFLPTPWFVVFASLSDKDWSRCIDLLTPHANTMIFTQTQSTRAVPAISLFQYTREAQPDARCLMSEASSEALTEGLRLAAEQKGTLLVLGSLTLIGEAMEFFHLPVFTEFEPGD